MRRVPKFGFIFPGNLKVRIFICFSQNLNILLWIGANLFGRYFLAARGFIFEVRAGVWAKTVLFSRFGPKWCHF